jgi:hypothetical protein
VTVEIFADDAIANIVEDGFDAGIRLGEMIAEDMITVRLTPPFRAIPRRITSPISPNAAGPRPLLTSKTTTASPTA